MRTSPASLVFLLVLAGAAAFVWNTSGLLPEHVASHFNAAGQPNYGAPGNIAADLRYSLFNKALSIHSHSS